MESRQVVVVDSDEYPAFLYHVVTENVKTSVTLALKLTGRRRAPGWAAEFFDKEACRNTRLSLAHAAVESLAMLESANHELMEMWCDEVEKAKAISRDLIEQAIDSIIRKFRLEEFQLPMIRLFVQDVELYAGDSLRSFMARLVAIRIGEYQSARGADLSYYGRTGLRPDRSRCMLVFAQRTLIETGRSELYPWLTIAFPQIDQLYCGQLGESYRRLAKLKLFFT